MREATAYSVGEVARLAATTVRALHHYDAIGLLQPSVRTENGYRQYDDLDLARLHRILGYRELGFSLEEIADFLAGSVDVAEHLHRQQALLAARIARLQHMSASVDRALEAHMTGINLTPAELFEVFGETDPLEHAAEAEQRWGDSDAYRESRRRSASYGKAEWQQIKAEGDTVHQGFADTFRAGAQPESAEAMAAAEAHRAHIERWFYAVSYDMHRGLATMFVTDPRFAATYNDTEPGLAQWVHDAIMANADHGSN